MSTQSIDTTHCDHCKRMDLPSYHVTVQRDGTALCYQCVNEINEQARRDAAEARRTAARCEVDGCNRRGTWRLGISRELLVCGHHKGRIQKGRDRQTAGWSALALIGSAPMSREQMLELAS